MKKIILFLSLSWLFVGCAATKNRIAEKARPAKPANCLMLVFMPGQVIDKKFEIVGALSVQETGAAAGCSWEDTLTKNKESACLKGADAIQFLSVDGPSIRNSCYASKANFIAFTE